MRLPYPRRREVFGGGVRWLGSSLPERDAAHVLLRRDTMKMRCNYFLRGVSLLASILHLSTNSIVYFFRFFLLVLLCAWNALCTNCRIIDIGI